MLDTKITKRGTILIQDGYAHIEGFDVEGAEICREVAIAALLWGARLLLDEAIATAAPGNQSKCSGMDLPQLAWPLMNLEHFCSGDSDYRTSMKYMEGLKCQACDGSGSRDDAAPGDIDFNEWECPECEGTGFDSEYRATGDRS